MEQHIPLGMISALNLLPSKQPPIPENLPTEGPCPVWSWKNEMQVEALENQFPGLKDRICEPTGELRSFVNVYINGEDIRFVDGMSSSVASGDEISIVPAVAGGN